MTTTSAMKSRLSPLFIERSGGTFARRAGQGRGGWRLGMAKSRDAADKTDVSRISNVVALTCSTPPRAVNDQASNICETATITATSPIKIRPPGVPICHIGSSDAFIRQF